MEWISRHFTPARFADPFSDGEILAATTVLHKVVRDVLRADSKLVDVFAGKSQIRPVDLLGPEVFGRLPALEVAIFTASPRFVPSDRKATDLGLYFAITWEAGKEFHLAEGEAGLATLVEYLHTVLRNAGYLKQVMPGHPGGEQLVGHSFPGVIGLEHFQTPQGRAIYRHVSEWRGSTKAVASTGRLANVQAALGG